jgi:hypothetical protein
LGESKYAELNEEQLKEIKRLEKKLNVTLIAYENSILESPNCLWQTKNVTFGN